MKKISEFTSRSRNIVQNEIMDACRKIAKRRGLALETKETKYDMDGMCLEISFRLSVTDSKGNAYEPERQEFERLAPLFGFSKKDYKRIFKTRGEEYRITGLNNNRPKYPVSAERLSDGTKYKFDVETVLMIFRMQDDMSISYTKKSG